MVAPETVEDHVEPDSLVRLVADLGAAGTGRLGELGTRAPSSCREAVAAQPSPRRLPPRGLGDVVTGPFSGEASLGPAASGYGQEVTP